VRFETSRSKLVRVQVRVGLELLVQVGAEMIAFPITV